MSHWSYLHAQVCRITAIHSNNVALKQIHIKNVAQELLAHLYQLKPCLESLRPAPLRGAELGLSRSVKTSYSLLHSRSGVKGVEWNQTGT